MSYEPHTWVNGETITAAKLNNLEEGVSSGGGGSVLICNSTFNNDVSNYVLDKTVQEIYNALLSGTPVYIKFRYGTTSDYMATLYLAPVVKVYTYDSSNLVRIVAVKPIIADISSTLLASPGCLVYSATGLNKYPIYLTIFLLKFR